MDYYCFGGTKCILRWITNEQQPQPIFRWITNNQQRPEHIELPRKTTMNTLCDEPKTMMIFIYFILYPEGLTVQN